MATGAGSGAVQREVARLAGSGLLALEPVGNQKHYRANPDCPIHDELVAIVRKTFGLAEPLREALAPLVDRIQAAFVYGSVAKRSDTASSDMDLMLISDTLTYAEAMAALHDVSGPLGREVAEPRDSVRTSGSMTYSLEFVESALKEWRKLSPDNREQLKKRLAGRLGHPRVRQAQLCAGSV